MKMKMKTKNGKKKVAILDDKEEYDVAYEDRVAEKMLRVGMILPVTIDPKSRLDFGSGSFTFGLYNENIEEIIQLIDIRRGQIQKIPATLELDENDKDLRNLGGYINIIDPSRLEFSIDVEDEELIDKIEDKVEKAFYDLLDRGSIIDVRIYPKKLASTPTRYTLALNDEGVVDEAKNVRRIRANQTASEGLAEEELRALLESEDVTEVIKEKGLPSIDVTSYVMDGVNVDVDPSANGDMVMRVKRPNGIIQGISNGAAGLANGTMKLLERLSRDRIILDADARKSYQQNYKVDNNKIEEMTFKETRTLLFMKLSESIDETADLRSRGVGRMGKRGGNKKNVNNSDDFRSVIVASIECEDGIKMEGRVREVRASSNENEIVMVVNPFKGPFKRLEAGAVADIRRRERMGRSRVTIMEGLMEDRWLMEDVIRPD
jgi:hypothetical protein